MSFIGIFIGMLLTVVSVSAAGHSNDLRMLGFREESKELYTFSMFLAVIGFILIVVSYPKIAQFYNPPMSFF
jgi:hypothetical protein